MLTFKEWFVAQEANLMTGFQQQTQAPTYGSLAKAGGVAAAKAAVGAIPVVGAAASFIWDMVNQIKRSQTPATIQNVLKMMQEPDNARTTNNFFDLDDTLSDTMSDNAKIAVAKKIMQAVKSSVDPKTIPQNLGNQTAKSHLIQTANAVQ